MWRRLDCPGHDWARLTGMPAEPRLRGTALFIEEGVPARLDYRIRCDSRWATLGADIVGWIDDRKLGIRIERDPLGLWRMDGRPVEGVRGCDDVDLSFSPATNLPAIRRLSLRVGEEGEARAAWLRFPALDLVPLVQRFRRIAEREYAYASDSGFTTTLVADARGFVVEYPPLWTAETSG